MTHTATYSPEDNKIRLYVGRVPRPDYERLIAAGFYCTPKQDCNFAAHWTPEREDLAREFLGPEEDIGDEDYSPTERAADRAERFEEYREKRTDEATGHADTFESAPGVFGHQNADRAQRQADRHEKHKHKALSQWSKASYWQYRTAGVIAHALHRADPRVRRGRIKTLEAEQRKMTKHLESFADLYRKWKLVLTLEGVDQPAVPAEAPHYGVNINASTPAAVAAYCLANSATSYGEYQHPRTERKASLYSLMTDGKDPITAEEAANLWLGRARDPDDENSRVYRWAKHYENRLAYEKAMLANEGGSAADVEMVPGGWITAGTRTGSVFTNVAGGRMQIHAVVRSPVTKQVTSVKVMGTVGVQNPQPGLVTISIERLGERAYTPPTEEELAKFKQETASRKAEAKSMRVTIALINPTLEDALKLQAHWNAKALARHAEAKKKHYVYGEYEPTPVIKMTQAQYSNVSKGTYSSFETVEVFDDGHRRKRNDSSANAGTVLFKIRKRYGGGTFSGQADSVVVITDKPQKPLPLDWDSITPPEDEACHAPEPMASTV